MRSTTPGPALIGFLLAAPIAAPRVADAAPLGAPPAHVIEFAADDAHHQRAQLATQALRERVVESNEYFLVGDNRPLTPTANDAQCDTKAFAEKLRAEADRTLDKRCQARIAKRIGAKAYFWGHLYEEAGGRLMVKLHLYDETGGDRVKALPYEERARQRVADRLYQHLVRPNAVGDVRLVADSPLDGTLYLNGREAGAFDPASVDYTAPLGELVVEVRSGATVLAQGRGTVTAGGASSLRLERVVPPVAASPTATPARASETPETTVGAWREPVGWASLGLGAVLFGAGAYASSRVSSYDDKFGETRYRSYREGFAGGEACANASQGRTSAVAGAADAGRVDDLCAKAALVRTLQYVFYGAGVLSVGAGAYLLLSAPGPAPTAAPSAAASRWRFVPAAAGASAGATLHVRF